MRALSHVKVLDLTRVVAGPWCTQTLADLGADVIKIERPGVGDDTRRVGPYVSTADGLRTQDSAFFLGCNRNKRSVTVDITTARGAALVRELALSSDVLVENYKVGALQQHGLDGATLCAAHPGLVYCSVTGFGQDGPYAPRPAYDSVLQAMGGLMSTCGVPDGEPGAGPMRAAVPITDIFTGLYATIAILAALTQRAASGRGQRIDMAMIDVTTALNAHLALGYLMTGEVPQRQGNLNPITAPSEVFRASDGYFLMSAGNDGQFAAMLQVLGLDLSLAAEPRFAGNAARIRSRAELHDILQAQALAAPMAHWIERLSARGVPCAAINDMRQLFEDPQVQHRGLALRVPHASGVDVPTLRSPLRLPLSPVEHRAPPMLGQHTRQVLQERLGLDLAAIEALQRDGIV
ncbi:MAG: CoA transferase [Betaproteobacteria bacterium]|nr:CoA transferase [Betaproteobacteria bacterium]